MTDPKDNPILEQLRFLVEVMRRFPRFAYELARGKPVELEGSRRW